MKKESLLVTIAVTSFVFSAFLLISGSMAAATPLSNQNGTVSSIQNGPDGRPTWKVSGTWNLINQSSKSPIFNAAFDMMKLDGSSMHKHTIFAATITSADFKVIGKTSTRTYYGTAIISMKEGPVSNVPIVIKLLSDGSMSIMPDPIKTKGHFGNTPIQGKTNMSS
jgi:hypothetical protein